MATIVDPLAELSRARDRVEELERRLAEEQGAAKALREELRAREDGDQRYRQSIEKSPDAIFIHDAMNRIVFINDPAIRLLGVNHAEQLLGQDFSDFVHPEDRSGVLNRSSSVAQGALVRHFREQRQMRLDGSEFYSEVAAIPIDWNGEEAAMVVIRRIEESEIARRKAADVERWAKLPEGQLSAAIESLAEGFALFDADDRLVMFNRRYRDEIWPMLSDILKPGVTFDEIISTAAERNVLGDNEAETNLVLEMAHSRHKDLPLVSEVFYPSGRCIRHSKYRTADGGTVALYLDVTERAKREQFSRERDERHRRLLETLPDAITIHSDRRIAYVNPAAIKLYGARSHQELVGRRLQDIIHPDDLPAVKERHKSILMDRSELGATEQRRVRLDGSIVPVEARAAFIEWNGKPALLGVVRDLTERKHQEAALRETERRLASVAANMPGAIFQRVEYPDGTVTYPYISQGARETHGVNPEAAMRNPDLFSSLHHPEDRPRYLDALAESIETLAPFNIEFRVVLPDGVVKWLFNTVRPHRREDGATVWDCISTDITEMKQAEQKLRESEETARALVDAFTDYAALLDNELRILALNDPLAELWGVDADSVLGKPVWKAAPRELRVLAKPHWHRVLQSGERVQFEYCSGGRWYYSNYYPIIDEQGKTTRVAAFARDITEQKEAQERLNEAKEAAEFANRSKSEFLANMSHELRTPLNAVIGFSEILKEEMLGPLGNKNYQEYVGDIHESGVHLLEVINDILDISKIEAGKMAPSKADIDPRQAVDRAMRMVGARAEMKNIEVETRIAPNLPEIHADERMLVQVLINLLSNAVKFTPDGGRVRITARRCDNDGLEISVIDSGIGIAKEDFPTVMAPFGQVESAMSRRHEGTGLGLPLVQSFLDLHDGRLRLRSKPGMGTKVSVWFPRTSAAA